jgi:hypothetical protein
VKAGQGELVTLSSVCPMRGFSAPSTKAKQFRQRLDNGDA